MQHLLFEPYETLLREKDNSFQMNIMESRDLIMLAVYRMYANISELINNQKNVAFSRKTTVVEIMKLADKRFEMIYNYVQWLKVKIQ